MSLFNNNLFFNNIQWATQALDPLVKWTQQNQAEIYRAFEENAESPPKIPDKVLEGVKTSLGKRDFKDVRGLFNALGINQVLDQMEVEKVSQDNFKQLANRLLARAIIMDVVRQYLERKI